jgi:type IV fimbrial biogenesis protein FimT
MNSPPPFQSRRLAKGFTLVELMVTISVLAVLMAVGIPSFQGVIASSRVTTATNDFMATLAQARSNAIRRGARVTVCKSADGATCVTTGGWEQGWIMFNDDNHSAVNPSVDSGETITFSSPALTNGIVMKGNMDYVSFGADGLPKNMNGSGYFGTIRICSTVASLSSDKRARDLVINRTGRSLVQRPTNIAATCPFP